MEEAEVAAAPSPQFHIPHSRSLFHIRPFRAATPPVETPAPPTPPAILVLLPSRSSMPHPASSSPSLPADPVKATSEVEVDDTRVLLALAGPRNEKLKALEREAGISVGMRGNRILLEGAAEEVALAERFLAETAVLLRAGRRRADGRRRARAARCCKSEPARPAPRHVRRRRSRSAPAAAPSGRAGSRRSGTSSRSARTTSPSASAPPAPARRTSRWPGRVRAPRAPGEAHRPHAARGRGGREARLPAGRPRREGEPLPAPALRRARRHDGHRQGPGPHRARPDRGRARSPSCAGARSTTPSSSSTRRRTRPASRCACSSRVSATIRRPW